MFVVFTVAGSAAEENVIWMVEFVDTLVVPDGGVIAVTENGAGETGLTGMAWPPLPQPVKSAKDKAAKGARKQDRALLQSMRNIIVS